MYIGYLYICCVLGIRFLKNGVESFPGTYEAVGSAMCFLQLLQYLEVLHNLFGYTSGGVLTALMQMFARSIVLFPLLEGEERMQTKPVVFYLFLTWSFVEIIRYEVQSIPDIANVFLYPGTLIILRNFTRKTMVF